MPHRWVKSNAQCRSHLDRGEDFGNEAAAMSLPRLSPRFLILAPLLLIMGIQVAFGAAGGACGEEITEPFPTPLEAYGDQEGLSISETLSQRIAHDPFNLIATVPFGCAILFRSSRGHGPLLRHPRICP